jgi:hypothetical protein
MLESDPDFAMGHIFTLGMEAFGKPKKKLATEKRSPTLGLSHKVHTGAYISIM